MPGGLGLCWKWSEVPLLLFLVLLSECGKGARAGVAPQVSAPARSRQDAAPVPLRPPPCKPMTLRELPHFKAPPPKCKRFFDWSPISVAAPYLADPKRLFAEDDETLQKLEVIHLHSLVGWRAPPEAEQKALLEKFRGSNHFLIYGTASLPLEEAFNRMVFMASSRVVALVRSGEEGAVDAAMLDDAAAIMGRHERLALLGFGAGWLDGRAADLSGKARRDWAFVDAVASGPVFVRRAAFLQVGSLWRDCESSCFEAALVDLSLRLWEAEYTVAIAANPKGALKGSRRRLQGLSMSMKEVWDLAKSGWLQNWTRKTDGLQLPGEGPIPDLSNAPPAAAPAPEAVATPRVPDGGVEFASGTLSLETQVRETTKPTELRNEGVGANERPRAAPAPPGGAASFADGVQPREYAATTTFHSQDEPKSSKAFPRVAIEKGSSLLPMPSHETKPTDTFAPGGESCNARIAKQLGSPTSRQMKVAQAARQAASRDTQFDTVDASEPSLTAKTNEQALGRARGGLYLRPPSIPVKVCSSIRQEALTEHRCSFETPTAALILQYFKRAQNIQLLAGGITNTTKDFHTELLINDDSQSDLETWLTHLRNMGYGGNTFIFMSSNIHEIRGYNRLSKFTTAEYLAHLQDDDIPNHPSWLRDALVLFRNQPRLAVLGGLRGRMDYGTIMDTRYQYINGPKYGVPSKSRGCCKKIVHWDKKSKIPFMFAYKVNLSPFILPRDRFLEMGMYHLHFSCAGEPGIGLDFELSIRAWRMRYQTGLYSSQFRIQVGASRATGTRSSKKQEEIRHHNELRNNKMMYHMHKGFHHKKGNAIAGSALKSLPAPKKWEAMNDAGGTRDFLKLHRGWYRKAVVSNSRKGNTEFKKLVVSVNRRGKGT